MGYRAEMDGQTLVLNVGYSHPVRFVPPQDISFAVENRNKTIIVSGIDKQVVGEVAANIRKQRPRNPIRAKAFATGVNTCGVKPVRPVRFKR